MNKDINQQILEELRRLNRNNKRGMIVAIVLLIALFIYLPIRLSLIEPKHVVSWTAVSQARNRADFDEAMGMAQTLLAKSPKDYYAHSWVGTIYLAMGRLEKAEEYFSNAYDLLPSEENEKLLKAVRTTLKKHSGEKR